MNQDSTIPLCVDLDGTLVHTDTLIESFAHVFKKRPFTALALFFTLRHGRAHFKRRIISLGHIPVRTLPYNKELLEWLHDQKKQGTVLCLATASDGIIAEAIGRYLGIFDHIVASDGTHNLSAGGKAQALIAKFGKGGFDYIGNSFADIPVWHAARHAYIANAGLGLLREVQQFKTIKKVFVSRKNTRSTVYARAIRIHQWIKNLLLFVPVLTAHKLVDETASLNSLIGFFSFSFMASSMYLINDLLDLEADRSHPTKKNRPLASGELSVHHALITSAILLLTSFLLSLLLPPAFFFLLKGYFILNLIYTIYLKRILYVDVLMLAFFYALRILAGSFATGIPISSWLIAFVGFMFLSLALVKRTAEVTNLQLRGEHRAVGRAYTSDNRNTLMIAGLACAFASLVIFELYIQSPHIAVLYSAPAMLRWLTLVFGLWLARVWYFAYRGTIHDDPTTFAVRDAFSYVTGILVISIIFLAS